MTRDILIADVGSSKDEPTNSPKKNPCGMCRANGLRVCKGHGSGAGGCGSRDSSDNKDGLSTDPSPKLTPKTLRERLAQNLALSSTE